MQYFLFFLFRTSQYCHKNSMGLQLVVILALGKRLISCWPEVLHVMRAEGRVWCTLPSSQESHNRADSVFVLRPTCRYLQCPVSHLTCDSFSFPSPNRSLCFVPWHGFRGDTGLWLGKLSVLLDWSFWKECTCDFRSS